jgi:hypothetical protein
MKRFHFVHNKKMCGLLESTIFALPAGQIGRRRDRLSAACSLVIRSEEIRMKRRDSQATVRQ